VTRGWGDPRPILVGVGSLLLIAAGVVQVLVVALIVAVAGANALILGVPIALLAVADIVLGWRIRSGRDRRPALIAAFLTLLTAPFTLGTKVLGLTTILASMVAVVALTRHRIWFERLADAERPTADAAAPTDDPGPTGDEVSGSDQS
jgi:hypothetical protein